MRGVDDPQEPMFSYVSLEARVRSDHPLRLIRSLVDQALSAMAEDLSVMYSRVGRRSIPPERLLRAMLLQVLYSIRSERQLTEQIDYNMLFRWFVGLSLDEPVWHHSTFTKNRERFLLSDISGVFFDRVLRLASGSGLLSDEHFTVDGTLIESWASLKSFRDKSGSDDSDAPGSSSSDGLVSFHGERRSNMTHESSTDPDSRLYRKGKGKESKLSYMGHVLMENRSGLVTSARVTRADGFAERDAALEMLTGVAFGKRVTLGADKGYDAKEFISLLRELNVTPHVAQNDTRRRSAIDGRTVRHSGYAVSQRVRKRVEEVFGWLKTIGGLARARHRGLARVEWAFRFAAAVYNLVRMKNILLGTSP